MLKYPKKMSVEVALNFLSTVTLIQHISLRLTVLIAHHFYDDPSLHDRCENKRFF